jgi:predicted nucleic acid-binding protein
MTHLFDSTALFCLYFREAGNESLLSTLDDPDSEIGLSALSLLEFASVLKRKGGDALVETEWQLLRSIFIAIVPASEEIALRAVAIRRASASRIPAVDALIAGTAAVHGAVLVHRDPHFLAIPMELLRQEYLD